MFLIPTVVQPSPVAGFGVFTESAVPAGTLIWEFTEGVDLSLEPRLIEAVPEPLRAKLKQYCYVEPSGRYILCGDNARFMNHSFDPNCDDSLENGTVTRRDIEAGEELTCDYRQFDVPSREDGLESWR